MNYFIMPLPICKVVNVPNSVYTPIKYHNLKYSLETILPQNKKVLVITTKKFESSVVQHLDILIDLTLCDEFHKPILCPRKIQEYRAVVFDFPIVKDLRVDGVTADYRFSIEPSKTVSDIVAEYLEAMFMFSAPPIYLFN